MRTILNTPSLKTLVQRLESVQVKLLISSGEAFRFSIYSLSGLYLSWSSEEALSSSHITIDYLWVIPPAADDDGCADVEY